MRRGRGERREACTRWAHGPESFGDHSFILYTHSLSRVCGPGRAGGEGLMLRRDLRRRQW